MKVHTIDLVHGTAGTTAAYLLESGGEAALVESGPDATYPNLVAGLARHGLAPRDVRGVRIAGGPVLPPTPPPDIDLPVWRASLARLRALKPVALYPTHFDRFDDVEAHLDALERELSAWAEWVKARMEEGKAEPEIVPLFEPWLAERLLAAGQSEAEVEAYRHALPFAMNVTGLVRYFRNAAKA